MEPHSRLVHILGELVEDVIKLFYRERALNHRGSLADNFVENGWEITGRALIMVVNKR